MGVNVNVHGAKVNNINDNYLTCGFDFFYDYFQMEKLLDMLEVRKLELVG